MNPNKIIQKSQLFTVPQIGDIVKCRTTDGFHYEIIAGFDEAPLGTYFLKPIDN